MNNKLRKSHFVICLRKKEIDLKFQKIRNYYLVISKKIFDGTRTHNLQKSFWHAIHCAIKIKPTEY